MFHILIANKKDKEEEDEKESFNDSIIRDYRCFDLYPGMESYF